MNKYYWILGAIILITIIAIVVVIPKTPEIHEGNLTNPQNYTITNATLNIVVIDNNTKLPIENVIVYAGTSLKCYTNSEGKCQITFPGGGDYGLFVFKKGYNRFENNSGHFIGNSSITVNLEKKAEMPATISISGRVIDVVLAKGSASENHYLKIKADSGTEYYLFDEIGFNRGFKQFVNKEVTIIGFIETGYIGWQWEKVEGIYVEEINQTSWF